MSAVIWRMYYEDGSVFDNTMGPPEKSPHWGVIGIQQRDEFTNSERIEGEYFIYRADTGKWSFHGPVGIVDQLVHFCEHITCVRAGRYVTSLQINENRIRMGTDADFANRLEKSIQDQPDNRAA